MYYSVLVSKDSNAYDNLRKSRSKTQIKTSLKAYESTHHPFMGKFVNHKSINSLIGTKYWKIGDKEKAISQLQKAVQDNPYDRVSWFELGNIYDKIGNRKNAIDSYIKAIDLYNNDIDSSIKLARIAIKLKDKNMFNRACAPYYNKLYYSFIRHYEEGYLTSDHNKIRQVWRTKCDQIDTYQNLIKEWDENVTISRRK